MLVNKMQVKATLIILLFIGLLSSTLWFWQSEGITSAPDLSFTSITGKKINLSSLQGKPVIVSFWATDCTICLQEIPHLIELYQQFHSQGLEIIAITMYYDPPNQVVKMSKVKQLPYDIVLDLTTEYAKAFGQIKLIPTTFLISPSGNIVLKKTGMFDSIAMKQAIKTQFKG